jgi:hypothetical protein
MLRVLEREMRSVQQNSWLAIFLLSVAAFAQAPPDVIYYNGSIIPMSLEHPTAHAVAMRGDRFAAVGTNGEVLKTALVQTAH